jgi:hypothetical protein
LYEDKFAQSGRKKGYEVMNNPLDEAYAMGNKSLDEMLKILKGVNNLLPVVLSLYIEKTRLTKENLNIWQMMNPRSTDTDNEVVGVLNSVASGLGTIARDLRDANESSVVHPIEVFTFFFITIYPDLSGMTPYNFIQDHTHPDRMKKVRTLAVKFHCHTSL